MVSITLKAARVNKKLSQKEAAEKLGVNVSTLGKYENDSSNVTMSFVKRASELYGIPADSLFFGSQYELIRNKQREEVR